MNPLNLCYRLAIYLSIALTIFHPSIQIAASPVEEVKIREISAAPRIFIGQFESGLSYTLIPSSCLRGGTWITLTVPVSGEEGLEAVSLLTGHSLFYGTKGYTRENIRRCLNDLGLDIEADSNVLFNGSELSIQFCLSNNQPKSIHELLSLLNQLVFAPTLEDKEIELARSHLLKSIEQTHTPEELLLYKTITAVEVRNFFEQWYRAEKMQLNIVQCDIPQEIIEILPQVFGTCIKSDSVSQGSRGGAEYETDLTSALMESVDLATDNKTLIVDGKIWMNAPNWYNKSGNGRALGALLTVLGIGGMILAIPIFTSAVVIMAPIAFFAGSMSTAAGLYFLTSDYLKDPYYVEYVRQQDLQNGCAYAYKNHRAGITLTPYERRMLFLQEMVDHPHTLAKCPILLLADLYHLSDPIISEIFTVEEFNFLTQLKRDFIQQRNQYKMLKENLENELNALATPYALARDAALLQAKDVYYQNYYVVTKKALKAARDQSIDDIKKAFKNNQISLSARDAYIEEAEEYYSNSISSYEFKMGLAAADSALSQRELEIEATYAYQVELCKQSIHYYERMASFQHGEQSLIFTYDNQLRELLATFPVYLPTLPDYLDLRSL